MNYYEILGVTRSASQSEIKDAYKALVKKYHPDVYTGDKSFAEKKIKEINVAYDVLSDFSQKQKYDTETFGNASTYSYTPPNNTYTSYQPSYSNSSYSYTTKRRPHSNSKYSYENYKKTYRTSSYEYEKRYTDYHRSKSPNSNYTSSSSKFDEFHDNITNSVTNKFDSFSSINKLLIFIIIFILYLILFVSTFLETDALLNGKSSGSILNTKKTTTYNKTEENSKPQKSNKKEEFDINDYYTDEQLKQIYSKGYYTSFETFSEFKDFFEDFVYDYYYSY